VRLSIDAFLDYTLSGPADLLFALEVAQMHDQVLITDRLVVGGVEPLRPIMGDESLGRRTWAFGKGRVTAHYTATVDIARAPTVLRGLRADRLRDLPPLVVPYLFPSRYCEADRFETAVRREFGEVEGGDKIQAMADWIRGHLDYVPGSSDVNTTAVDTYVGHRGVCRDFAHLLIAMARAAGIPARMVGAYAWQLDPPDFHAVAEIWLQGEWHLVDPTGLAPTEGIVRIGVGRDATDISFLTVFGQAQYNDQRVRVEKVDADSATQVQPEAIF
jgi:transglutaminase-like putative cysteine protease